MTDQAIKIFILKHHLTNFITIRYWFSCQFHHLNHTTYFFINGSFIYFHTMLFTKSLSHPVFFTLVNDVLCSHLFLFHQQIPDHLHSDIFSVIFSGIHTINAHISNQCIIHIYRSAVNDLRIAFFVCLTINKYLPLLLFYYLCCISISFQKFKTITRYII